MQFSFWTSLKPDLVKKVLLQGTALAGCGALILILASILMPKHLLETWGMLLFVVAASLIAIGLVPYRRLQKLESNPNKLIVDETGLHYCQGSKTLATVPLSQIQSLEWQEKPNLYGIRVHLKNGKRLFLPFFSHRTYTELTEILF